MAGRPVFDGAVQLTSRLVVELDVGDTEGAAGLSGGSSSSVTDTVTVASAWAVPSLTLTVRLNALAGVPKPSWSSPPPT